MNDHRLLQEYTDHGSEQAFAELVKRHADTVYTVCLRRIGDVHLAEDAAQAVFLALAQKAEKLRNRKSLSGWLVKSAVYAALNAVTIETRRREREERMGEMNKIHSGPEPAEPEWQNIAPFVDNALLSLKERDRDAVVLRFYQGRSHREIAEILAVSEAAVRKRVSRALDRLRKILGKKGIVVPAAVLGTMVIENAVHAAPVPLVESCVSAGVKMAAGPVFGNVNRIAKGIMKKALWTKVVVIAQIIVGLAVLGAGTLLVKRAIYSKEKSGSELSERVTFPPIEDLPEIADLPDPFIMRSGRRVKTFKDWEKRREEIKAMLLHYQFGHMPPPPGNVTAEELRSQPLPGGKIIRKKILLSMGPAKKLHLTVQINFPTYKGPFPVIILNRGTYIARPPSRPPLAEIVERGYLFVEYFREDLDLDAKNTIGPAQTAYPNYDWATIAVWVWGGMRVIDYLMTLDGIDPKKIIVTGHSRGADTALLLGALDERVALTVPNAGSAIGTSCYRFVSKKRIKRNKYFGYAHWYLPYIRECAQEGLLLHLPFDVHFIKALVAPRGLVTINALDDHMVDPLAVQHTNLAAKIVFDWLGAGDKIGMCFRERGDHNMCREDWLALLDYADLMFFRKYPGNSRTFDKPAFPDAEPIFSWKAPAKGD